MNQAPIDRPAAGEIVAPAGTEDIYIGEPVSAADDPRPLPRITVDEPTISMMFGVNVSPFSGREGRYVTSRKIRERLDKEALDNVAIRVEDAESMDTFKVSGRAELQLAIIIEMMRREGYEVQVPKPEVITRTEGGGKLEPIELAVIYCPETF